MQIGNLVVWFVIFFKGFFSPVILRETYFRNERKAIPSAWQAKNWTLPKECFWNYDWENKISFQKLVKHILHFPQVPIIKFMSYLTSHMYLMFLLMLVGITPIYPVVRPNLVPYWYEWTLLVWLSGLLLFELTNPSDKSGLGWVKLAVLLFGIFGVALHLLGKSIRFIVLTLWHSLHSYAIFINTSFKVEAFLFS